MRTASAAAKPCQGDSSELYLLQLELPVKKILLKLNLLITVDPLGLKGKHFSRKVTPLFPSMLVQPIEDEGEVSERPSESQPIPSPTHPSEDQPESQPDPSPRSSSSNTIPDSILEGSGGIHGATQIKDLKAQIKELKKKAKPVITHHNAWIKSVFVKKRLARKKSMKKNLMQKESVSKQGRKPAKSKPTVHKDPTFDDLDDIVDDALDYMETKDAQYEGRTSSKTMELNLSGTDKLNEGTTEIKVSTDRQLLVLITISQNKVKQKEKEKGVELKNVEDSERPRPTSTRPVLTLKPLLKIDPKVKGKKKIKEEDEFDIESEDITEAKKKFKMLANDEEIARKVQEE
ncbi:hypothetical protein Tco_0541113 [Tanacetum coccineum]